MVLRENGVGISRANKVSKGGGNCRKLTAKKGGDCRKLTAKKGGGVI